LKDKSFKHIFKLVIRVPTELSLVLMVAADEEKVEVKGILESKGVC
jgi:hypothetical protein